VDNDCACDCTAIDYEGDTCEIKTPCACSNGGVASGFIVDNDCACNCTGTGYDDTICSTASACVATASDSDDGADGNFYCINGGTIGGNTTACTCDCVGESAATVDSKRAKQA
jgi:hypothetical protein